MKISSSTFIDLYVGETYCRVSGLNGAARLQAAPDEWMEEIAAIRDRCEKVYAKSDEAEFSLSYDEVIYRATAVMTVNGDTVFILRKSEPEIREFEKLGYPQAVYDLAMQKSLRGIVLFGGQMKNGKTVSASSLVIARLIKYGGTAFAIEDPQETNLDGMHGDGLCIHVVANEKNGGYHGQLKKGIRSGADQIYIGEIRDGEVAYATAQAGINGHLIVTTGHGGDIPEVIERAVTYASERNAKADAAGLFAQGLALVIWQELESRKVQGPNGPVTRKILKSQFLIVQGEKSVQAKIREGRYEQLKQDIEQQRNRATWDFQDATRNQSGLAQ